MHHCYLAKRNVTERIYRHIILGEIMKESGGPDVSWWGGGGEGLYYAGPVSHHRQTDRHTGYEPISL